MMPKLCKPTREAILNRIEAVKRHAKIRNYHFQYPLFEGVFGLDNKIHKFSGNMTIEDIIEAIKIQMNANPATKK